MKRTLIAVSLAASFALAAPLNLVDSGAMASYPSVFAAEQDQTDTNIKRLNLIIKKLRDAMSSMKDFDELEKAGLDKRDVDRMRKAMEEKIRQMMNDAISTIRSL